MGKNNIKEVIFRIFTIIEFTAVFAMAVVFVTAGVIF